jgi:uncharacterized protein YqcC (DUF446 family)
MKTKYEVVDEKIKEIETEMKKIGMWQKEPLPSEVYRFSEAFAMDTMTFSQWLQFVFIPRVKDIIQNKEAFPSGSSVGTQAIREFDSFQEASRLVTLLCEFDSLF